MIKSGIYKIKNKTNNKVYIGSAYDFQNRWRRHEKSLKENNHHSSKLQRAWNKHGESNFVFEVVEYVEDKSIILEREQFWLDELKAVKNGYNVCPTAGSPAGVPYTEERRKKISKALTGQIFSNERRIRISESLKGKKQTKEQREKRRNTIRERGLSEKHKRSLSKSLKGRAISQKNREATSRANKGKILSDERKLQISQTLMKRPPFSQEELIQINNMLLTSATFKEIAQRFNCSTTPIRKLRDNLTEEELKIREDACKKIIRKRNKIKKN